jgi:hypothetical protein
MCIRSSDFLPTIVAGLPRLGRPELAAAAVAAAERVYIIEDLSLVGRVF